MGGPRSPSLPGGVLASGNLAARLVQSSSHHIGQFELLLQVVLEPRAHLFKFRPRQPGNPGFSNGVATFPFNTIDGQSYTVQRNDEVETTNWVFHTNFTGNGGMMQFAVPVNEATQRFFRVRQP